jgi:ribosomal protein S17
MFRGGKKTAVFDFENHVTIIQTHPASKTRRFLIFAMVVHARVL